MFHSRQQEANENKQKDPCLRREGGKKVHFGSSVAGLEFCLDAFVPGLWEIGVCAVFYVQSYDLGAVLLS